MFSARVSGHPGFDADGYITIILDQENAPEKEHPQARGGGGRYGRAAQAAANRTL
jgi:hypothetical protein